LKREVRCAAGIVSVWEKSIGFGGHCVFVNNKPDAKIIEPFVRAIEMAYGQGRSDKASERFFEKAIAVMDDYSSKKEKSMKFWMVMQHSSATLQPPSMRPAVKHFDKEKAQKELKRLAEAHPGISFFLLEAVEVAVTNTTIVTKL